MATVGPNFPGTGSDDASIGTQAWSNPTRIQAEDASNATASGVADVVKTTHYLKAVGFGFSIPAGATILGILVETKRFCGTGSAHDSTVSLLKAGSIVGANRANIGLNWPGVLTYASLGGSSDLWGTNWNYLDINDANFGVVLSASLQNIASPNVDAIRITITYSLFSDQRPGQSF